MIFNNPHYQLSAAHRINPHCNFAVVKMEYLIKTHLQNPPRFAIRQDIGSVTDFRKTNHLMHNNAYCRHCVMFVARVHPAFFFWGGERRVSKIVHSYRKKLN